MSTGQGSNNAELVNKLQNALAAANEADDEEEYPQVVVDRIVALNQLDEDINKINEEYLKERIVLENKYLALRSPTYEKRVDIITGKVDVEHKVENAEPSPENDVEVKGIPNFWVQAIQNHPVVGPLLTESDIPALQSLQDIKVAYNEDWTGFKLTFIFGDNEFFTNKELTKSYTVTPNLLDEKAPSLTAVDGTEIEWKEKKNLCEEEVKKKQKGKGGKKGNQTRLVTVIQPKASFFHYFTDPDVNKGEHDEEDDDEEDNKNGESQFKLSVDEDYEVGHSFRAEIIPEAIRWFTGEACDDDFGDDGDYEDDEEGDEDEEDDEDEGPADESEDVGGSGGLAGNKNTGFTSAPPGEGAQPGECKQS